MSDRTGYLWLFDINFNGLNVWNGGNKKINKFLTQVFFCFSLIFFAGMTCILCNGRSTDIFVWKAKKCAISCFTESSNQLLHFSLEIFTSESIGERTNKRKSFIFFCQHAKKPKTTEISCNKVYALPLWQLDQTNHTHTHTHTKADNIMYINNDSQFTCTMKWQQTNKKKWTYKNNCDGSNIKKYMSIRFLPGCAFLQCGSFLSVSLLLFP